MSLSRRVQLFDNQSGPLSVGQPSIPIFRNVLRCVDPVSSKSSRALPSWLLLRIQVETTWLAVRFIREKIAIIHFIRLIARVA